MDRKNMNDESLIKKINNKDAKIGIIGMGYVGVPLGIEFTNKKLEVIGFDTDNSYSQNQLNINDDNLVEELKNFYKWIKKEF